MELSLPLLELLLVHSLSSLETGDLQVEVLPLVLQLLQLCTLGFNALGERVNELRELALLGFLSESAGDVIEGLLLDFGFTSDELKELVLAELSDGVVVEH